MYSSSTPRSKSKLGATGYLARPKLGALKNTYTTIKPSSRPSSGVGSEKRKKVRKPSLTKLEYKKKPDYADTAYRDAVSRLRILLAESYVPIRRPLRELDSAGEETDNQSVISAGSRTSRIGRSRYQSPLTPRRYNLATPLRTANMNLADTSEKLLTDSYCKWDSGSHTAPPELMSFIERQEEYIEQLERESRFCRDELSNMLGKVKDVISENENLHEKQKSNLLKSVFDHLETETETETELEIPRNISKSPKHSSKHRPLEGPTIVFESRISELEAQLTQTKIDLKKAQDENESFKRKLVDGTYGEGVEGYRKQLDNLQREKAVLQDTVSKLQSALTVLRDKENSTCDQVKRSLDVAEQAQYEKTAAEHEIRRLKDELERQHGKLRDAINEQSRRIADERSAVERRYSQQIEQLTAELGVQWEQTNKQQLELDKQRRENADLRRELAQKQAHVDDLRKDMNSKIMTLQSDIGVSGAEKSALEQQIATLQLANERQERQSKQESLRLQAELQSLRQRLDRADGDLIHSRRENIRLTEQVANLEKELKMNEALADERSKRSQQAPSPCNGGAEREIMALPPPKEELSTMIQDIENKHAATVAELEGMIHTQNQLMDKLSNDCQALTRKLDEANVRHKRETDRLLAENDSLTRKLTTLWASLKQRQEAGHQYHDTREEIRELQTNLDYLSSRFTLPATTAAEQDKERPTAEIHKPPPYQQQQQQQHKQPREISGTQKTTSAKPETPLPSQAKDIKQSIDPQLPKPKVVEQTAPQKPIKEEPKPRIDDTKVAKEKTPEIYSKKDEPYEEQQQYGKDQEFADDMSMQYDPEHHQQYDNQQYEGGYDDQQYMTQDQYDQQYGQYDPNADYSQQEYDPNYAMDQQYVGEEQYMPDQQYSADRYPEQTIGEEQKYIDPQPTQQKYPETQPRQPEMQQKIADPQPQVAQKQYPPEPAVDQQKTATKAPSGSTKK